MQVQASNNNRSRQSGNPWLIFHNENSSASFRLICFAYAGGNANAFRNWINRLDQRIELVAIQYPGRATRFKDALIPSMDEMIEQLEGALADVLKEKPYALFGHSMGASIAFELAHHLVDMQASRKVNLPSHLIVSGRRGPGFVGKENPERKQKPIHTLPKAEFLERLRTLNGTPEEILAHEDLMDLMEPVLRNDFKLVENWEYRKRKPLTLPLSIYGGKDDQHLSKESLEAWKMESVAKSRCMIFPGDHFYLHQQEERLIEHINEELGVYLP